MIYVSTYAGKGHSVNEDAILVGKEVLTETSAERPAPESGFICIADGVGGNRGGAQASRFVLKALSNCALETAEGLKECLEALNQRLIATAAAEGTAPDMATTLTGFYVHDGQYKLIHVGNTRAYIKQGNYLKQITPDHTTYHWLRSSGQLEAAEACSKAELTNCFGGSNPARLAKLFLWDCPQFSLALLTSDGVHEYVDLDSLEAIVSGSGSMAGRCEEIIRKAKDAGSEDDLSVVIICPSEA